MVTNCCPSQLVSKWVIIANEIFQAYFVVFFLIAGMAHLQIIEDSLSVGLKIELLFFAYEPPK